jgi:hypothetical protein
MSTKSNEDVHFTCEVIIAICCNVTLYSVSTNVSEESGASIFRIEVFTQEGGIIFL